MTAVDRNYLLGQLYDARRVQEGRAQLPDEKTKPFKRRQAEGRSYTLSLLIDAINGGLLEQLHAEAEQALFLDVAVDQDRAWAAYMAGMASPPESTAPLAIEVNDEQPEGQNRTAHYGGMPCPGCPDCIGYADPTEADELDGVL